MEEFLFSPLIINLGRNVREADPLPVKRFWETPAVTFTLRWRWVIDVLSLTVSAL